MILIQVIFQYLYKMKIVNDAINISNFNLLQNKILSEDFPWYFINNSAYNNSKDDITYSFHHTLLLNYKITSNHFDFINSIALQLKDKFKLTEYNIFRLRLGLTVSYGKKIINNPHIDVNNREHKVILFYINDSDGDTYFYKNNKIIKSISPEKNKAILFDGNIYHSSSKPEKNLRRIVLNLNLEK